MSDIVTMCDNSPHAGSLVVFNDTFSDVAQISSTLITTDGESVDYNFFVCYQCLYRYVTYIPTTVIVPTLLITVFEPSGPLIVCIH